MKTINLFFKFHFTSLSPDAQPISLGIVALEQLEGQIITFDDLDNSTKTIFDRDEIREGFGRVYIPEYLTIVKYYGGLTCFIEYPITKEAIECGWPNNSKGHGKFQGELSKDFVIPKAKSFYAEFSGFDINRCDDWVKENVVNKLKYYKQDVASDTSILKTGCLDFKDNIDFIKKMLIEWLKQFSDYQIQFIMDCSTKGWEWMLELLAEWEKTEFDESEKHIELQNGEISLCDFLTGPILIGIPKLSDNISPVPFDLNDLISIKKGISPKEAFDLNREELAYGVNYKVMNSKTLTTNYNTGEPKFLDGDLDMRKHNAIWDAQAIKEIYQKLK